MRLIGIDMLAAFLFPTQGGGGGGGGGGGATDTAEGTAPDLAAFLTAPGRLLVTAETAAGPLPGGLLDLVIGEGVPPAAALTDIGTAARLLGQTDPSYLVVAPNQPAHLPPLPGDTGLNRAAPAVDTDVGATDRQLSPQPHRLRPAGLCRGVGLFIVHSAIGLAFEQRRATVRTLRALGTPLRTLLTAFCSRTGPFWPCFFPA